MKLALALVLAIPVGASAQIKTGVVEVPGAMPATAGAGILGSSPSPVPTLSAPVSPGLTVSVAPTAAPVPAALAAVALAAPSAPVAIKPGGWIGDHEETLLHGTPEQIAGIEAAVHEGVLSLRYPGDERARRAAGIIRGATEDWTPRRLEERAAATAVRPADAGSLYRHLLLRRVTAFEHAGMVTKGPIEKLAAAAGGAVMRNDPGWDRSRLNPRAWIERLSRRTLGNRREIVEGIAARVPGMIASRFIYGLDYLAFNENQNAYATGPLTEHHLPGPGWAWIRRLPEVDVFHAAAHEGTHQSQTGITKGRAALTALYGQAGDALGVALLEGWTELQARRVLETLHDDALAGRAGGLGRRYLRALRGRYGGSDTAAWVARRLEMERHPYHAYVELALELERRPGGREALEAFVSSGDPSRAIALIGEDEAPRLGARFAEAHSAAYGERADRPLRRWIRYAAGAAAVAAGALPAGLPLWGAALIALAGPFLIGDVRNAATLLFDVPKRLGELGMGPGGVGTSSSWFGGKGKVAAPHPDEPSRWTETQARAFLASVVAPFEARLEAAGYVPMPMLVYDDPEIDCRVKFDGMFHNVIVSRGFLKIPGMTADALALAIVHEVGHMLGAGPKDGHMRLAVEGEADYFSGSEGAALLAGLGDETRGLRKTAEYAEAVGWLKVRGFHGDGLRSRARALAASLRLRRAADGGRHDLERPDESVVAATLTDYPSGQARLDTMAAGIAGLPRPRSWANPEDFAAAS